MNLLDDAAAIQGELTALRRALHREPELGLHLPRTQQRVLAALDGLDLEVSLGTALSSVTAVLRGGAGTGPTILLRGDMDALPVTERTGLDFAATDGHMHACGHDLHTAMLIGAARLLAAHADELAGNVVFMFQPGEEGFDGARHMMDEGVLSASGSPAQAAFALHVTSSMLPRGTFAARPGPIMSAIDTLRVTVRGAGGHGSMPHRAQDPIPAACEMVTALQTFVTRRFDVFDPVVITVGTFHAGQQHNIIPDIATFEATVRSFSRRARERAVAESTRLCQGIAAAHGMEVEANVEQLYPVTINDAAQCAAIATAVTETFGAERWVNLRNPSTGSEDFSLILGAVPGAMAFLGACPPDRDPRTAPYNHSPEAAFDDAVLADGAALYARWAIGALATLPR